MKNLLMKLLFILLFFQIILAPSLTISSAKEALTLWACQILPALFPSMILCGLLIELRAATLTARLLYPLTKYLLGISLEGTYCFMTGIMCGYPMGVKSIVDMSSKNQISISQANSLLSICAFPSPMFLIGFIYPVILKKCIPLWWLLLSIYLPCLLLKTISDMIAYFHRNENETIFRDHSAKKGAFHSIILNIPYIARRLRTDRMKLISFETIDELVLNNALLQLKIGGYMVMFSILGAQMIRVMKKAPALGYFLGGCCEMSMGIARITQAFPIMICLPVICFFLSFGGLSTIAQTTSLLKNTKLKETDYILYRLIHGILSGLIMFSLLYFKNHILR